MWIKQTKQGITENTSSANNLILLWRANNLPIYVMDNHLAAAWCWMQECKPEERYNFFHIDRHNDLGALAPFSCYKHVKENPHLSIDEYTGLRNPKQKEFDRPAFTWDNYINQTIQLFPDWFGKCVYATHTPLDSRERKMNLGCNVIEEMRPFELSGILDDALDVNSFERIREEVSGEQLTKWIINIDLDYFFYSFEDDGIRRLVTDDYIQDIAIVLKRHIDRISVITVALSPECCGGWKPALEAALAFIQNDSFLKECEEFLKDKNLYSDGRNA